MPALFVTGAGGFVGRRFIDLAAGRTDLRVTALVRNTLPDPAPAAVDFVRADLLDPAGLPALDGIDTVVHLAALTGKAPAAAFRRVNVEATTRLLEACRRAGVRRFLFVSSIAAKFTDTHYPYADSKRDAEAAVRASGLRTVIVQPTIILGPGSPIGERFRTLATAPVVPVFGHGRALIQPIHVDDLARVLLALIERDRFDGETLEVGGPDIIPIEEFLRRVHRSVRGSEPRTLHIPVVPLRALLSLLEKVSIALVPFTAGQLASFSNDGVAVDAGVSGLVRDMRSVDEMIADLVRHG